MKKPIEATALAKQLLDRVHNVESCAAVTGFNIQKTKRPIFGRNWEVVAIEGGAPEDCTDAIVQAVTQLGTEYELV